MTVDDINEAATVERDIVAALVEVVAAILGVVVAGCSQFDRAAEFQAGSKVDIAFRLTLGVAKIFGVAGLLARVPDALRGRAQTEPRRRRRAVSST